MHRATVTIPDDLEEKLEEFIARHPAPPSLAAVVQAALRRMLDPDNVVEALPIHTVLANRRAIIEVARSHGVSDIRLFGSVARGEVRPESDIDLLVVVGDGRTLFDLARLRAELETLLDASVDVVPLTGLEGDARAEVLAEAIQL